MTTIKLDNDDACAFDWQVACLGQVGGGDIVAGGAWFFSFKSKTAKVEVPFVFLGAGFGFGIARRRVDPKRIRCEAR